MSTSVLDSCDVVVVGAGICGVTAAAAAARRGLDVVIIEKEDNAAAEGSGRAQGIIRLQGRDPAELPLAREALEHWRAVEHPEQIELVFNGNLYIGTEAEMPMLRQLVAETTASGLDGVELLTPEATRKIVPAARGPFAGAMWSPIDGHCQPDRATQYFLHAAQRAGARVHFGTRALGLELNRAGRGSVHTDHGMVRAETMIIAGGVWTPHLLAKHGVDVPVMPVALSEREIGPLPPLFSPAVRAFGFGGRQRPDGRVVLSNGLNAVVDHRVSLYDLRFLRLWLRRFRVHRRTVRLQPGFHEILEQLRRRSLCAPELIPAGRPGPRARPRRLDAATRAMATVFPDVHGARVIRSWAGVVDMSPDGLPIIDTPVPGLAFVTGLSGHGFTLGPAIGPALVDLACEGRTERPIAAFGLDRFDAPVPIPQKTI